MQYIVEIAILPKDIENENFILKEACNQLFLDINSISHFKILKRSIDARSRVVVYRLKVELYVGELPEPNQEYKKKLAPVTNQQKVIIIGAGPAGYFAALELLELGIKPIIFERGKDVQSRRRDLKAIQQFGVVNPNSNYCFGEGGAGTYSDGKLYTRSHKRGKIEKVLQLLVEHGAPTDILIDAHPHIGSNKLPQVVANIRETIIEFGGEIHFDALVTGLILEKSKISGVIVNEKEEHFADAVIVATGHSARDIYYLLDKNNIKIEPKPFALGVRIEHPQDLVDAVQYHQSPRDPNLPASSYSLVTQVQDRGVFSFCMCPGGLIVPAATAPGEIVVNGMSMSRRDSKYANSGTVTAIELEDFKDNLNPFSCLDFQKKVEQDCFNAGDGSQKAPAQRLTDFVNRKISNNLSDSSYIPGLFSAPLHQILPTFVYERLKLGVVQFGKMMKGYFTEEANVVGTESRTSAPIRIPRDKEHLMHPDMAGLFPCGEGAGYAGGIISAALDGQNVAKAVKMYLIN
ncbi:MAG: FAD-dependent monooxygenase [Saprospiraceae bacterium]|nr:FAD-dependent monooxygenase [Saprospiraceae bacterium]